MEKQSINLIHLAVEFSCSACAIPMRICRSCWRNQRYCSNECARLARLKRHQVNQRKYRQTEKGIKAQALAQRRYRLNLKNIEMDRTTKRQPRRDKQFFINGCCSFCESLVQTVANLNRDEYKYFSLRRIERDTLKNEKETHGSD